MAEEDGGYIARNIEPIIRTDGKSVERARQWLATYPPSPDALNNLLYNGEHTFQEGIRRWHYTIVTQPLEGDMGESSLFYQFLLKQSGERTRYSLIDFSLETGTGEIKTALHFAKLLPSGWKIIYSPNSVDNDAVTNPEEKVVHITGDLTKVGTIFGAVHEIGHAVELASLSEKDYDHVIGANNKFVTGLVHSILSKDERFGPLEEDKESIQQILAVKDGDLATILARERNAWAFALQKMRHFLTPEEVALARTNIHMDALDDFSGRIREIRQLQEGLLKKQK